MKLLPKPILSLDAGFRHTGYVVASLDLKNLRVLDTGCIHTLAKPGLSVSESNRLSIEFLISELWTITNRYHPKYIVAELPMGSSKSQKAATAMGLASGAIVAFCKALGFELKVVRPLEVKRFASRSPSVSKEMVIDCFSRHIGADWLPSKKTSQEHVADAGIALLAFLQREGYGHF